MKRTSNIKAFALIAAFAVVLVSCDRKKNPGLEFAPNMYNSVGYESQTQIEKNNINPNGMNMRLPVTGTIARRNFNTHFVKDSVTVNDLMFYNLTNQDEAASETLVNPIPLTDATLAEGETLYNRYCQHCHGASGAGDGKVGEVYAGVPNYASDAYKNLSPGRIFFAITFGKNRMWPHGAQVNPEERWKIVHYVQKLQKGS